MLSNIPPEAIVTPPSNLFHFLLRLRNGQQSKCAVRCLLWPDPAVCLPAKVEGFRARDIFSTTVDE
jgi:hypothetical protein